jgi:hypothetical protein
MTTIQIKQHYVEIAEIIGNKISEKFGTESEPHANGFTNNQMGVLSELMMLDIFSDPVHIGFYHEGMPPFDWDIFAGGISYDVKSSAKKQFCISKKIIDENRYQKKSSMKIAKLINLFWYTFRIGTSANMKSLISMMLKIIKHTHPKNGRTNRFIQ